MWWMKTSLWKTIQDWNYIQFWPNLLLYHNVLCKCLATQRFYKNTLCNKEKWLKPKKATLIKVVQKSPLSTYLSIYLCFWRGRNQCVLCLMLHFAPSRSWVIIRLLSTVPSCTPVYGQGATRSHCRCMTCRTNTGAWFPQEHQAALSASGIGTEHLLAWAKFHITPLLNSTLGFFDSTRMQGWS